MPLRLPPGSTFLPKGECIFCRMLMQTDKWKEGSRIIIPDIAKEEVFVAEVLRVGPGRAIEYDETKQERIRMKPDVTEGETILFARYHGERIEIDGAYYLVLREDDILGRILIPSEKREEYLRPWTIGEGDASLAAAKVLSSA